MTVCKTFTSSQLILMFLA